ncbi:unnamed protein product [Rotaria magnacalcarata]|uniref:Uncharacterized protein n=1 Tax=Rotaria magnacalcarata TaxID=392030 RepID=A0A819B1M7_9BILA|nr:unnamed protein product [Rotaria magnacalcarata]CAF1571910.1 unnamed protein product [Rotaria magnacalcarata]CAF2113178.1 unnamed protein product [Rotaria magnacalcarata]CAF2118847.1 unnamed protein product [Rotaria magnacalcarata]CAF2195610.1 unnamed protein product [Rotaria magnacalcarata]
MNLSSALARSRYENDLLPIENENGRLILLHENIEKLYPFKTYRQSSSDDDVFDDDQEKLYLDRQLPYQLDWFKRDAHLDAPVNKRMLCFFHAVNCFG